MRRDAMPLPEPRTWIEVPGTHAAFRYAAVRRGGVGVLEVTLRGGLERDATEVDAFRTAIDAVGTLLGDAVEVSVLDVRRFGNAPGDEAQLFTSVLTGLPACWVTHAWQDQRGDARWDLPASEQMVDRIEPARRRVVAWRTHGGFTIAGPPALTYRWTERGLQINDDAGQSSLWHHNRLVESVVVTPRASRIVWPVPDRSGVAHEALRRGASLQYRDGQIVYAGFDVRGEGRRVLDWREGLRGLDALESLRLEDVVAADESLLDALACLPRLSELALVRTAVTEHTLDALGRGAAPALVRLRLTRDERLGAAIERLRAARPALYVWIP